MLIPTICANVSALATPITVTAPSKIDTTALGIYFANGTGNSAAQLRIWLIDQTNSVVATSVLEEVFTDPAIGGQFGVGGVLRQGITGSGPAFIAAPGAYTLRLNVVPEGLCSGANATLRGASLTYRLIAS